MMMRQYSDEEIMQILKDNAMDMAREEARGEVKVSLLNTAITNLMKEGISRKDATIRAKQLLSLQ